MQWQWSIDGWIVLAGVLSACSCALLGNYLVLRRLSLMGDAVSHAVLPGLAAAFLITSSRAALPMFAGAVVVGVLTALLTQVITRFGKVEHGAAMGVVFSILFAVGLVMIRQAADHVDLDPGCVLYGALEQIPLDAGAGSLPHAVANLAWVFALDLLFVVAFYKELKITAFDPALATTLGINANLMHYLLMVMVAVTTVACFEAVGSILVIAMLIVPAVTAHLLTDRLGVMIVVSVSSAAITAVSGHILALFGPSWFGAELTVNTAGMMAVTSGVLLCAVVLLSPRYGVVARAYHQLSLSGQIVRQDILGLLYRWQELRPRNGAPMQRSEVLAAVGDSRLTRRGLRALYKQRAITEAAHQGGRVGIELTDAGRVEAQALVGSHRLWEAYLARHFNLAADHLHAPAERMEHYITPALREELRRALTEPTHDPHGRPIPEPPKDAAG